MKNSLKFLLNIKLKRPKSLHKTGGFTLIELLVAMIIAALVIAPLLGFMLNILETDRKEQAKANSEQEIKAALDYIAQDLEQAVYIYDNEGLDNNYNASLTSTSGIKNQIPPIATGSAGCSTTTPCVPVLVFWKRSPKENVIKVAPTGANCPPPPPPPGGSTNDNCDDAFVYSLVGYYLIKDNNNPTWSSAARIGRFEITDGVRNPSARVNDPPYIPGPKTQPSAGFAPFKLSGPGIAGTLQQKMNRWQKDSASYTNQTNVLIDYIDQSPQGTTGIPPRMTQQACGELFQDTTTTTPLDLGKLVPSANSINSLGVNNSSFYACVDSANTRAQVFIRGNALARIRNDSPNYSPNAAAYFPTASIQIKGRGFLYTK